MTDRQILIVKTSWSALAQQSQEVGELFYQKLFELEPAYRALFRNDMELQTQKFTHMMTWLIRNSQHPDQLSTELAALALRHKHYGAQADDYAVVGAALLGALQQQLGSQWDGETQQAWTAMYATILQVVIPVASNAS